MRSSPATPSRLEPVLSSDLVIDGAATSVGGRLSAGALTRRLAAEMS